MSIQTKNQETAGKSRGRHGARRAARPREIEMLALVSEHRLLTVDQVARLLGVGKAEAARRVHELVALGWAEAGAIRGWDAEWVWLRSPGYRRAGTGFGHRPFLTGQLGHVHAITEARLALQAEYPQGRWVCERELWRRGRGRGFVPDGLLELPDGRRLAVEVEMSRKPGADLGAMMALRSEAFDEVIYFGAPITHAPLEAAKADLGVGNVVIRGLAGVREAPVAAPPGRRSVEPDAEELAALRLISEEGLVAVDQLGLLLGRSEQEGVALAARLERDNLVRREFETGGDAGWLRCPRRPNRLSGTGLSPFVPTGATGLGRRAVLARIRAEWCARPGNRGWLTRRMLVSGKSGPRRADVPVAVAESGSGSYAVVFVDPGVSIRRRRRDLQAFSRDFDGVLCFADSSTVEWVRDHVSEAGLGNVEIGVMP